MISSCTGVCIRGDLSLRVLAVDLPGYGGSSKPSAVDNYSIEQLTEDIRDFIETLGKYVSRLICSID